MSGAQSDTDSLERAVGLSVSILVHLVLAIILLRAPALTDTTPTAIEVTFEPPPMPPLNKVPSQSPDQIVSPSQAKSERPPEKTKLVSELDSVTEHEQIKRGDSGGVPGKTTGEPVKNVPTKQERPNKESPPKEQQKKVEDHPKVPPPEKKQQPEPKRETNKEPPPPHERPRDHAVAKLTDLRLDPSTMLEKYGAASETKPSPQKQQESKNTRLDNYQAFNRPTGSGAAFLGLGGINDHLPNLPDGDMTLLNAKAGTYAGFVRRVATQVFGQLRTRGWERLSAGDIRQMTNFTTIEAVMSPQGKLLRTQVLESSGSPDFDTVVDQAATAGAKDPNPPPGAEAGDGNIHFIFKARSWSDSGSDRRTGAPIERRWLLLATGLE